MTSERRKQLRRDVLRYIADHMEAVLAVEGPYDMVSNEEESEFLESMFKSEADRIRRRYER